MWSILDTLSLRNQRAGEVVWQATDYRLQTSQASSSGQKQTQGSLTQRWESEWDHPVGIYRVKTRSGSEDLGTPKVCSKQNGKKPQSVLFRIMPALPTLRGLHDRNLLPMHILLVQILMVSKWLPCGHVSTSVPSFLASWGKIKSGGSDGRFWGARLGGGIYHFCPQSCCPELHFMTMPYSKKSSEMSSSCMPRRKGEWTW